MPAILSLEEYNSIRDDLSEVEVNLIDLTTQRGIDPCDMDSRILRLTNTTTRLVQVLQLLALKSRP